MMNNDPHILQRRATLRRGAVIGPAYGEGGTSVRTRRFLRRGCLDVPSASECLLARRHHRCPADPVTGARWPSQGSAGAFPERRL
jgi:hypothetical protein